MRRIGFYASPNNRSAFFLRFNGGASSRMAIFLKSAPG
jgi:hypothetical protein